MNIMVTWESIITASAVLGAVIAIISLFAKLVRWVDKQTEQDEEIKRLKKHHEDDIKAIKEEQTLLVEGVLACLLGLQEKGCNGPVTKAIDKYTEYLNKKAHE
jgi:phosphoglycolate phosphatase-like HAD superfamily hydrolase